VKLHEKYISRCIKLSKNGFGTTRPNPSVGSVIVNDNIIIGEGYTSPYGDNHAEVNAIESVKDKSLLKKATIYVSLEPCSHQGKTPPCSNFIVDSGIKNVVVGCLDDNSLVSGRGIKFMKDNGCKVVVGVLENECKESNKRFLTFHNKKRPYIILKWAETKDGFIDKLRDEDSLKEPNWISNTYSQQIVHQWRSEEHAIMVGTNTVIQDNPKLNVRNWSGKNPIRVVLDNSMRIPINSYVFDGSIETIVFTSSTSLFNYEKKNLSVEYIDYSKNVPQQICDILYKKNIQSIIIEGGAQTIRGFVNSDLWDEARIFIGDVQFEKGLKAPEIEGLTKRVVNIDTDILKIVTSVI
jgi:diaminohydroxyphosphoribosylaminopyrimidine deaminase/5-amino-6-(5-phosphoribosylamino)uracil reductase